MAQLGARRIEAVSTAHWPVDQLDSAAGRNMPEEIDSLASRSQDDTITVLVWRHTDDQYQRDGRESEVEVTVSGLNAASYTVRHNRIDSAHSNAHTLWQSLGCPQDPTDEQLAAIKEGQGLEEIEPARRTDPVNGSLTLHLQLPLPSVSLLVLEPG